MEKLEEEKKYWRWKREAVLDSTATDKEPERTRERGQTLGAVIQNGPSAARTVQVMNESAS